MRAAQKGKRKLHDWTEEEESLLRTQYGRTLASKTWLALQIGVTEVAVARKLTAMGISSHYGTFKPWCPDQDERLGELVGKFSLLTVARKMNRSLHSITARAFRLGFSTQYRDGWYTLKDVETMLGVTGDWLHRHIRAGRLKATYHHGKAPGGGGRRSYHIEEESLKRFIRMYPEEIQGKNVDMVHIVNILAGILNNHHPRSEGAI